MPARMTERNLTAVPWIVYRRRTAFHCSLFACTVQAFARGLVSKTECDVSPLSNVDEDQQRTNREERMLFCSKDKRRALNWAGPCFTAS